MRGNLIHFYVLSVIELKVYKSNNIKKRILYDSYYNKLMYKEFFCFIIIIKK